jgi:hypothetical protein
MANFEIPSGLDPKAQAEADDYVFSFRGSDGKPVRLTLAQFKIFIGSGMPDDFLSGGKIATKYLIPAAISDVDHEQPTVNGVKQDIQIRRAWLRQFIIDLGAELGWGTGTPATPLAAPALTLGTRTENSIAFSWPSVSNAASYNIYKNDVLIANVTSLSYTSTGLNASTSYNHYARAVPGSGTSYTTGPASNTITASTTGATGLPTPTAPTVTFNSSARTLSATHTTYPNGLEKRYNGGAWENWPDTGSVYVGTDAVAPSVYEWRVKAVSGVNLAGVVTGNTAIAASVVVTPGLTNVATPAASALNKFTFDASTATFTRSDAAAGNAPYCLLKERVLINSSTSAIIQGKDPGTNGGQSLVLHTSNAFINQPGIYLQRNPANPKIEALINGDYITLAGSGEVTGDILLRFKIEGLQITPQYSANNGSTWVGTESRTLTSGTALWVQVSQGENGTVMQNVQQSGFSIS